MNDKEMRTFRLIDKEGFIAEYNDHEELLGNHLKEDNLITGYFNRSGELDVGYHSCNIAYDELKDYFEEVLFMKETSPILWDGEQTLEVGMTVKTKGEDFTVKLISDSGSEVVLDMECSGLQVVHLSSIKPAKKTHKELTLEKVMKAWKGQGLDFAYDTTSSSVSIGVLFDVIYDIMQDKEGE